MIGAVTILLPAHDEAASVGPVVAACLEEIDTRSEVLVVDDGSADRTAEVARAAGARVLSLPQNAGKGAALRAGVAAARHDIIVTMDADGQDDPRDIPRLVEALDGADLVIGSRFIGTLEAGSVAWVDNLGNRLFTGAINRLFSQRLTDTQGGFRASRRDTWERTLRGVQGYEVETVVLLSVLRAGGHVVETPVRRHPRTGGHRDFDRVRDGLCILRTIVATRFR